MTSMYNWNGRVAAWRRRGYKTGAPAREAVWRHGWWIRSDWKCCFNAAEGGRSAVGGVWLASPEKPTSQSADPHELTPNRKSSEGLNTRVYSSTRMLEPFSYVMRSQGAMA